jgi:YVTN family beta-propeller protein
LATALSSAALGLAGCAKSNAHRTPSAARHGDAAATTTTTVPAPTTGAPTAGAAGGAGVYAHTGAGDLAESVRGDRPLVYVPNSESATVDVIDPTTFAVVDHFAVGRLPQHVTPSWDMRVLYVDNDEGNSLTPIDPRTGRPGAPVPVEDPYNLYFSPDGTKAIVVAERLRRLDIRDPHTWRVIDSIPVPCSGVDHADFTADGTAMVASCEFSGDLVRIDLATDSVSGTLHVGGQPVDVKLGPDGSVFYVANQKRNGVSVIDAATLSERGFIPTGPGAHGLYPSRDARWLYVTNRGGGSVSVLDFATGAVHDTWAVGGSPDMGGVSADGTQLWLSGRYDRAVYVIDTRTGGLVHTIAVGGGPHGLCVWPQPGRYSLGHTGNTR